MGGYITKQRFLPLDKAPYTPDGINYIDSYLKWYYRFSPTTPTRVSDWSNGVPTIQQQQTFTFVNERSESWTGDRVQDLLDGRYSRAVLTPFDSGHEFRTEKFSMTHRSHQRFFAEGLHGSYYRGPLIAVGTDPGTSVVPSFLRGRALAGIIDRSKGTTLMNRAKPTNSVANLSQMLGELVFDLPQIPFKTLANTTLKYRRGDAMAKAIGSEYLNQVFAWKPLVQDVLKVCDAIVRSDEIVKQYLRDAGPERAVRRWRSLPRTDSTATHVSSARPAWPFNTSGEMRDSLFPNSAGYNQPITTIRTMSEQYRFAGAFTYFFDPDFAGPLGIGGAAELARKVLGIGLTPELLWELAPWSWLADWFTNMGDLISLNGDIAQHRLLLRYGYLMRHVRVTWDVTHPGLVTWSGKTSPINTTYTYDSKERIRATPFDFGVKTGVFTNDQLAILAALGMTGSPSRGAWG